MMHKLRIKDGGSTNLIDNAIYDKEDVWKANDAIRARIENGEEGLRYAETEPTLLGI